MKKVDTLYWIFTGLYAAVIIFTSIGSIMSNPQAVKFITNLGYPAYFVPYIGVAKVLGCIAILIPGFPRIKEWAYAGLMFDLISAVYSFIAIKTPVTDMLPMLLFFMVLICSYIFYHKKLNASAAGSI